MTTLTVPRLQLSTGIAVFLCCLLQFTQGVDLPKVGFKTNITSKSETSGIVSVTLERSVNTSIETTVEVTIGGTATKDVDYVILTDSSNVYLKSSGVLAVIFSTNDTEKVIKFFIINDQDVESSTWKETIVLDITDDAAYNTTGAHKTQKINIADDDVRISCAHTPKKESDGTAIVTITRTGSSPAKSAAHSIECYTEDGTAVAPNDYTMKNIDYSFTSSSNAKTMSITISDDNVPEDDETFKVKCFTNDIRVHLDSSCKNRVVTIKNDDANAFFCSGGYAANVNEQDGNYSVDICRSGQGILPTTLTIKLCATTESGTNPSITTGCKNVTFTASNDRITEVISINNDVWGENGPQTFQVYLESSGASVQIIPTSRVTVTLKDDDNTFYLTDVTELSKTEGVGSGNVDVTINRRGNASAAANVRLELVFTATAESADCTGTTPRVIQFDAGVTSRTITACTVVDDRQVEDDETFKVKISGVVGSSNVEPAKSERTIKLKSNDVNITCQGTSLKEANGPAIVRLDRTGATAITANDIQCSTFNGSAFSPNDYQPETSATVSFATSDVTKNLRLTLKDGRIVERNESLSVTCNTSDPKVIVDPSCTGVQINIINDDTYVYFCPGYSISFEENVGSYTVRLCRVGVLEATHTVKLCRNSDSVSLPHDYPSVRAQCDDIVFAAYDEVKELVIPVNNDPWGEQEYKTFDISMNTTDVHVTFNDTRSYVVTIHDDDNTFCFTRTSATVYEERDKFVNLTIRRTGEILMSNASVIINTSPQTAITPEDYTEPVLNQRLNFFTGETEKHVTVNIVNDKLVEDDQTFLLSLTGVDGSTVFSDCKTSTVTIASNDVNIFCRNRRVPQKVYEYEGPVPMEFTREGSLQYSHTMRIRTVSGTAQSGEDFTAIDKTLTFAPNQLSITENVELVNDNVLEPNETFRLSVTSSDDRVHMICPGTDFTIFNDDTFIRCANQSIEVSEGNKTVYFTLKREGVLNRASPIWFSTKDDTAFDKSDYMPRDKVNRTFLPGQVYMTLSVDIVDDDYKEYDETFSVIIGSRAPSTLTSGDKCTLVTIKDNDPNRMTEQQAQGLLDRRRNLLIILGVAGAFMALMVIWFLCCICCLLRRAKKNKEKENS